MNNNETDLDAVVQKMRLKQKYLPDRYPSKQQQADTEPPTEDFQEHWKNSVDQLNSEMNQKIQNNKNL